MTKLTIPAHDRLGVRIFAAKLTVEDLQRDKARLAATLLGDPDLDPAYIEIFDVADLSGVGLSGYLAEGLGVPEAALSRDAARLDALKGPVLILLSRALHGREVTLTLDPRLTPVATYAEDRPPVHFEPLPTAAAQGALAPDLQPDRTPQRPGSAFLLLGIALVLTAVVALWLAFG
ncbi:MAG TPA: hypothetical protein VK146_12155 [Tabrizicola sp.]|nr:hypothetical protein [Tabrizicola sp.]